MDVLFVVPKKFSGTTSLLIEASKKIGLNYDVAFIEQVKVLIGGDNRVRLRFRDKDISSPKYVFPRIDGKRKAEGYKILSSYSLLGIDMPYPPEMLNIVHDKFLTSLYLSYHNIPVPRTLYVRSSESISIDELDFPIVVKLLSGSGGKGVMIVDNKEAFKELLSTLESEGKMEFLVQEYIRMIKPQDIRILMAGGELIGAMRRVAKEGEARANVKVGGKVEKYEPSEEEIKIAKKSLEVLNIDIGAVDLLSVNGNYYVIELNLNPGIRGLMKATDKDIALEIMKYVKNKIKR